MIRNDFSDELAIAVSAALRTMRLRAGLTLQQIAERIGTHRPIVGRIEHARHTTSLDMIRRFTEACNGSILEVAAAIDQCLVERGMLSEAQRLRTRPRVHARRRS